MYVLPVVNVLLRCGMTIHIPDIYTVYVNVKIVTTRTPATMGIAESRPAAAGQWQWQRIHNVFTTINGSQAQLENNRLPAGRAQET